MGIEFMLPRKPIFGAVIDNQIPNMARPTHSRPAHDIEFGSALDTVLLELLKAEFLHA